MPRSGVSIPCMRIRVWIPFKIISYVSPSTILTTVLLGNWVVKLASIASFSDEEEVQEMLKKIKDSSERVKSGFKVDVKEDKIDNLKFCFVFLNTENKYKFQCEIDEMKEDFRKGLTITEVLEKRKGDSSLDK